MRDFLRCLLVTVLWMAVPHAALAQPSASDRSLATELFKQGRELMSSKKFDEACPKLEESMRLDPGGGTLLNLAICHDELGKTATAWTEYADSIALAQRDKEHDREELALERSNALSPRLMRIVIEVSKEADVEGLVITRNGTPVARAAWQVAMPLDPGSYTIQASAPGREQWMSTVELSEPGSRLVVNVPVLEQQPEPAAPAPALPILPPVDATLSRPVILAPPTGKEGSSGAFYVAAAVTGGVGAVGLILGGVLGGVAFARKESLDQVCEGDAEKRCPEGSGADIDEMKSLAKGSTGSFVAGGIVLGAAATLLGIGISQDRASPVTMAFGPGTLTLRTRFE